MYLLLFMKGFTSKNKMPLEVIDAQGVMLGVKVTYMTLEHTA